MTTTPATIQEQISLPVPGGPAGAAAPSPGEILGIIRRRLVLITVLFFFLGSLAGAGFYVWSKYFPKYSAEGLVNLISDQPAQELSVSEVRLADREHERFVLTQSYIVKSPTVLRAALQQTAVRDTTWFKTLPETKPPELALYEDLSSAPVRGTNFLRISISTRNAKDPRPIVQEVMDAYLAEVQDRATQRYRDDAKSARTELNELNTTLAAKRTELKQFADRLPSGSISGGATTVSRQALLYSDQAAQLKLEVAQLQQLRDLYRQGGAITAEDRQAVESDPYVQALAAQLFQLDQRRAALSDRYGPNHDVMRQLNVLTETTEEKLAELRTEVLNQRRDAIRQAAETAYSNAYIALKTAMENLREIDAAQKDNDRALFDFLTLQDEIKQLEEKHVQLADYIGQLDRLVKTRSAMTISVAQAPVDPLIRSAPKLIMLPVLVLLALLLSVGLGIVAELMDTSVRTSQDVARHVQVALLGVVPDTDDEEIDIEHPELAVLSAPQSLMAEAFRRIRANLQYSAPAARQRSVLVTSPGPEDGKTTVACNLAAAVAQGGRRVLLVDGNLRRPSLHEHWAGITERGLTNLLIGEGTLADLAVRSQLPNLDVLGAGPMTPNPTDLLSGESFTSFLAEACDRYDQVFIDAPPVLLASDPLVLSSVVDGVIVTFRARINSRGAARRACGLLQSVNAHIFGAVLNAAQARRGGYFREQFRTYYDYNIESAQTPPAKLAGDVPPGD